MRYNQLGKTGVFVSELCLGTMTFGDIAVDAATHGTSAGNNSSSVWRTIGQLSQDEVDRMAAHAFDYGVNFIDTADIYSGGRSEEITGAMLRNLARPRHSVVLATKGFGASGPGPNDRGSSRAHLTRALDESLRRLGTDYVDLYQVHGFDPVTPLEETLRALDDFVRQGKVRYVGCSNWAAWQMATALGLSAEKSLARFASVQAYYSLAGRDLEREIVPFLDHSGTGLLVWSPLAGGYLTGKLRRGTGAGSRRAAMPFPPLDESRGETILDTLEAMASERGDSPARLALAWLLHQPRVTSVIMGFKRLEQLEDNLAAVAITLSVDELGALDRVSAPTPEYPAWMASRQVVGRRPAPFAPVEKLDL